MPEAFEGAAAEAYATIFESLSPCWQKHLELIRSFPNAAGEISILDLGSGPGEPACTLAAALPAAKIHCTDVTADMNTKAQARAEKKGVTFTAIAVCNGEDLSAYADASFDYVTMNLTLMFVPAKDKCLQECHRVLKPGGKVLTTCWKTQAFLAAVGAATEAFTGAKEPPPPPVNPMALKAAGAQQELGKGAGFAVAHESQAYVEIFCKDEAVFRACSLIVMGPKLKAMEEEGRANASKDFQDVFVATAPKVEGLKVNADGSYAFGGNYEMVVLAKADGGDGGSGCNCAVS